MNLKECKDIFMLDRATYCAEKSLEYYDENITKFIEYVGEEKNIRDISESELQKYVMQLRRKEIKNTSIRTYCRAVVIWITWLNKKGLCDISLEPMRKLPRSNPDLIIPLFREDVDDIDRCFEMDTEKGLRNYCIFHLMLDCGLRRGEVIKLAVGDVDFSKNILYVRDSKFGKSRLLPLPPFLSDRMQEYTHFHPQDGSFFRTLRGNNPLTGETVRTMFFRLKKNSGIDRIHPHLCRHTFATSFICQGGSLEVLRMYLGHYDYSVTRQYLHIAHEMQLVNPDEFYRLDHCFFRINFPEV